MLSAVESRLRLEHVSHDDAGGRWSLTTATPTVGPLRGVVAQMWEVRGGVAWQTERILPTAHVEVMFNLGEPLLAVQFPSAVWSTAWHPDGEILLATPLDETVRALRTN